MILTRFVKSRESYYFFGTLLYVLAIPSQDVLSASPLLMTAFTILCFLLFATTLACTSELVKSDKISLPTAMNYVVAGFFTAYLLRGIVGY